MFIVWLKWKQILSVLLVKDRIPMGFARRKEKITCFIERQNSSSCERNVKFASCESTLGHVYWVGFMSLSAIYLPYGMKNKCILMRTGFWKSLAVNNRFLGREWKRTWERNWGFFLQPGHPQLLDSAIILIHRQINRPYWFGPSPLFGYWRINLVS